MNKTALKQAKWYFTKRPSKAKNIIAIYYLLPGHCRVAGGLCGSVGFEFYNPTSRYMYATLR